MLSVFTYMRSRRRNREISGCARNDSYTNLPVAYLVEIKKFYRWASGPLSFTMLDKYFAQMSGAAATKTVAKYALKKLLKRELLRQNRSEDLVELDIFFKNIKTGKTNRRVHVADIITDREMAMIREKCKPKTILLCEALYSTGLRISELANVRLSDCEVRGDMTNIKIRGKGKKERRIMMATRIYDRATLCFASPYYLFGQKKDAPYTTRYLRRMMDECKSLLGRRIFPHLFRHSFITRAIGKTGKIKGVAEFVGHASPAFTLSTYVHEELTSDDLIFAAP